MTLRPVLHAQAKKKKKEEAANAKLLEAEKRIKVSLDEHQSFYFPNVKNLFIYLFQFIYTPHFQVLRGPKAVYNTI